MYHKDKIKSVIALILFAIIGLSYWLFGKEIVGYVGIGALVIWLGSMYFLNR